MARYYQENEAEFRLPDRARVNYLIFRTKDYLNRVKLTPTAVEDYLKEHQDEYTRPRVIQARQILLTLPPKATDAERRQAAQKAQELLGKARAGEDFAGLARAHSQDAASRDKGGDLGLVRRGQNSPEWDKVAFGLKPGTMGLAATSKGIYLIKLEEIKETERLPDAAKQVESRLKEEKARQLARDAAQQAREELSRGSLAQVAQKLGVTPQETPLIALSGTVPGLGMQPAFNQAALRLKPQEISKVVELPEGFAVLQGVEHQAAHLPPLAQIKDQVKAALKKTSGPEAGGTGSHPAVGGTPAREALGPGGGRRRPGRQGQRLFYPVPGFSGAAAGRLLDRRRFSTFPAAPLSREAPMVAEPVLPAEL